MLNLIREKGKITFEDYLPYVDNNRNHASKDLSKSYKMGFLDRSRAGKFFLYWINPKGLLQLEKKAREAKAAEEREKELADLRNEVTASNAEIYNLRGENATLSSDLLFCETMILNCEDPNILDYQKFLKLKRGMKFIENIKL